jgi:hypothetical protein
MKAKTMFPFGARVIVALLVASISVLWLTPPASAQSVVIAGPTGNLTVSPGDTIEAGYEVAIGQSFHPEDTVSMTNAVVRVSVNCPDGSSQTITINLGPQPVTVTADANAWFPSDTTFQGQTIVPSTQCGGKQGTTKGATFMAKFGHGCHRLRKDESDKDCRDDDHCFRFHIRDHNNGGDRDGGFSDRDCEKHKECESPETDDERKNCKGKNKNSNFVAPGVPFQMPGRNLKKGSAQEAKVNEGGASLFVREIIPAPSRPQDIAQSALLVGGPAGIPTRGRS